MARSHSIYSLDLDEFNDPPVSSPKCSSPKQSPSQPQVTTPVGNLSPSLYHTDSLYTTAPPPKSPPKTVVLIAPTADEQARVDEELEKRKARAARFGIPLVEPKKPHQPQPKKSSPANKSAPSAEVWPLLSCVSHALITHVCLGAREAEGAQCEIWGRRCKQPASKERHEASSTSGG